jgi:transcriptional regulator with XRE-family HTH domain
MTLGNAIKLIRTARNVRQGELALRLNVSPNYLSMLEADRRVPSITFLRKIASKLQVPAGLFLLWAEGASPNLSKKQVDQVRELLIRIQAIYLADASKREITGT